MKPTSSKLASVTADASPAVLTLPLAPEVRLAYLQLSDKYQLAIMGTADVGVLQALVAAKLDVDNILTKDNMYRLNANTALYAALLDQITLTNTELVKLKAQIAAVASNIATAAEVITAIDKVLTLVA